MRSEFLQLKSCTNHSIEDLVAHHTGFNLVIAMQSTGLHAYIALEREDENTALNAVGIKAEPRKPVYMMENCLYIVRERERIRGISHTAKPEIGHRLTYPVATGTSGYHMRAILSDFTIDRAVRTMQQGDYIQFLIEPMAQPVMPSPAFDDITNMQFTSQSVFHYIISASSPTVANALVEDLAASQAQFFITDEVCASDFTRRINCHMITMSENIRLAKAIDTLLGNLFKPDIDSLISPGTVQRFSKPDITIGYVNSMPIGFNCPHFLQNVAILGTTGSGKSELEISIIRQLHNMNIATLVIAPVKHDFSAAFPRADIYRSGSSDYPLRFNLLDLPHVQSSAKLAAAALGNIVSMGGDDSALPMILENCLQACYAGDGDVTLSTLATKVKAELLQSGYSRENARSLSQAAINRLKAISATPEFDCAVGNLDYDNIFKSGQITIVELNDMESGLRKAFATIFMERMREKYLAMPNIGRERPRLVIIIDELHELINERSALRDPFRDILNASLNVAGGQAVGHVFSDQRLDLIGEMAEYGCASHILMRGLASDQAAAVLRLPVGSPMLEHLHRLKPGECLLHLTGEDTIAVGAAPLPERNPVVLAPDTMRHVDNYCPYKSCRKVCTKCNEQIHSIVKRAVTAQLYGHAYNAYRDISLLYAQGMSEYKKKYAAHLRNPEKVPMPSESNYIKEVLRWTKSELLKAALTATVYDVRKQGLNPKEFGEIIRHCVGAELTKQMAFRLDI